MNDLKLLEIIPGAVIFQEFARFRGDYDAETLQSIGVPNPTSINWEGTVLTNGEKNAKGDLFLEFVAKKRKLTVGWDFLTQAQYRNLLGHLNIEFGSTNNVRQEVLYYKVMALNPNDAGVSLENGKVQPELSEMVAYLEGKYVGKVVVLGGGSEAESGGGAVAAPFQIGYEGVTLVFLER